MVAVKEETADCRMARRAMKRAALQGAAINRVAKIFRRTDLQRALNVVDGALKDAGKWRRTTGMTVAIEPCMDERERRAGLKRLIDSIQKKVEARCELPANEECETAPRFEDGTLMARGPFTVLSKSSKLMDEWQAPADEWVRGVQEGISVEEICQEFGLSRVRLTRLTQEYSKVSAQELVDGFKMKRIKKYFLARIQHAASLLWGRPGTFALNKLFARNEGGKERGEKRSKFFRMTSEDFYNEEACVEVERRNKELLAVVRGGFDLECWAVCAGFGSGARLKKACLNVLGKSLSMLEASMGREVVDYYLAAEDRVLREYACREDSVLSIRAREFYCKSDEKPKEPFLDRWSAAEAFASGWLTMMKDVFG